MTKPRFDYDDIVVVEEHAAAHFRPGERAWVVGVISDRDQSDLPELPPGMAYTIEFEDGSAIDIHEDDIRFL